MSDDLARLATEALADAERGTPGPWRWGDWRTSWGLLESEFRMTLEFNPTYRGEQAPIVRERDTNEAVRVLTVESEIGEADRAFIAAARTREPLLAAGVIDLTRQLAEARAEIDRMKINSDVEFANLTREVFAERDVAVKALRYLRRKIDGYDSTFEHSGFPEFKEK